MSNVRNEWCRVLWKKQPSYPDNYIGDSSLRVSKKRKEVLITEALYGATAVTQEICSCLSLVAIFFGLSQGEIRASSLLVVTCLMGVTGYIISNSHQVISAKSDAKLVCFYFVLISCATPMVKSLTGSVATDTINACTTALLLLRIVHQDYGVSVAIVNPTVSHNLGVFASVCLASRLGKDQDVFALITVAVMLFALFPVFRRYCRVILGKPIDLLLTTSVITITAVGLYCYASHLLYLFVGALVTCNVIIPSLYVYLQHHKQNIYGPWDEALIEDR
ncbi:phosphatidylinositol N-acetylglucosaminyltransferase subunit C-like [Palaemon carinicauda]|uniref:phosphatidylinositol N-acetylglucosaminyltransferase subunit C-like n=1 Tax=Palaemon carinicauda TaxID=392227 RepID=UPI0035B5F7DB